MLTLTTTRTRAPRRRASTRPPKAAVGPNGPRLGPAQTVPRSESDIRINFWNPLKIIAASNNIGGTGQQAQYYSSDGGATWGQSFLPLDRPRLLPLRSDRRLDLGRHRLVDDHRHQGAGTTLQMRAYKSTNGGATWTFDNTFSGTPDEHRQGDALDRPQRHLAVQGHHLRLLAQRQPGLRQPPHRPSGSWGTPIQVSGPESTGTAIGCSLATQRQRRRLRLLADHRQQPDRDGEDRPTAAPAGATPKVVATTKDSYDIGVPAMDQPPRPDLRLRRRLPHRDGEQRLRLVGRPDRRQRLHRPRQRAGLERLLAPARAASGSPARPTAAPPGPRR